MRALTIKEISKVGGRGDFCGPPGNRWIPDSPLGYDFSAACRNHDFNYSSTSTVTKTQADSIFFQDMLNTCREDYSNSLTCRAVAGIYYGAVSVFGGAHYQGGGGAENLSDSIDRSGVVGGAF